MVKLTGKQIRFLRGRGHNLKPLVNIGKNGLGGTLLRQVEEGLLANELIKVKVLETCPMDKQTCAKEIGAATGAALAQTLGRTLLFYRPHPEHPVMRFPP